MMTEAAAIPYDSAPLRGERLLVFSPHPDDEVIGCGGLIAHHLRERRDVRIVVVTDGSKATGATGDAAYLRMREEESRRGIALLGGQPAEVEFLGFPDRGLDESVAPRLREQIVAFQPDLICVPSPIEIHPDHYALAKAFCGLVQRDQSLHADLPVTRVAFYEVSQPLRPNTLVDITDVAEAKYAAIAAHASQITLKDYVAYARGLNAYRAMTLPPHTTSAEAYFLVPLTQIRTAAFSELRRMVGHPPPAEVTRETLPVTVIIRTKDRPDQLREAIASVRANSHPADVVVVNDGGADVSLEGAAVVRHETPRGRSEAMNAGVRAAKTKFIAFLDDDDLYYPEHLSTLSTAANTSPSKVAWYTDAVSTFLQIGPSGRYEEKWRLRLFGDDFDRDALIIDNYIPLNTLLVARERFLDAGGFDPQFDLFEDWDFLIRLSRQGDLLRVPSVTCEIRHFSGAGSVTLDSPEGTDRFRAAKLQVWKKHSAELTHDTIANAYERQKQRAQQMYSDLFEEKGRRGHAEREIERLQREASYVESAKDQLRAEIAAHAAHAEELEATIRTLQSELGAAASRQATLQAAFDETQAALKLNQTEVERLQSLLDMIYQSRTWKLHTVVERMKGRG